MIWITTMVWKVPLQTKRLGRQRFCKLSSTECGENLDDFNRSDEHESSSSNEGLERQEVLQAPVPLKVQVRT